MKGVFVEKVRNGVLTVPFLLKKIHTLTVMSMVPSAMGAYHHHGGGGSRMSTFIPKSVYSSR